MAVPFADSATRIAVVGASTATGTHLREALAASRVPGSRVDLYGASSGDEVQLGDYAGEGRIIQQPDLAEIVAHDVIFLCERGEWSARLPAKLRPGTLAIDLVGAANVGAVPNVHVDVNPEAARGHAGLLAVPHPVAVLVSEMLLPLERVFGIQEAVAVVLRPAADFGDEGVEELRQQTVRLLNFSEVPVQTFGRQLAFNIIPQTRISADVPNLEAGIAREVSDVLQWDGCRLTIRMLTAPIFYGHGVQLRVRLSRGASLAEVRAALERDGSGGADVPATPLDVSAESGIHLADVGEDGLGGFWLWAVAGELGARRATLAVRLAGALEEA